MKRMLWLNWIHSTRTVDSQAMQKDPVFQGEIEIAEEATSLDLFECQYLQTKYLASRLRNIWQAGLEISEQTVIDCAQSGTSRL